MKRDIYWQQMNLNLSDRLILLISGVFLLGKVFVAMELIEVETLNRWLCLSEDFSLFVKRPFTILTYAFYHVSFEHFLGNMLFLFGMEAFLGGVFGGYNYRRCVVFGKGIFLLGGHRTHDVVGYIGGHNEFAGLYGNKNATT